MWQWLGRIVVSSVHNANTDPRGSMDYSTIDAPAYGKSSSIQSVCDSQYLLLFIATAGSSILNRNDDTRSRRHCIYRRTVWIAGNNCNHSAKNHRSSVACGLSTYRQCLFWLCLEYLVTRSVWIPDKRLVKQRRMWIDEQAHKPDCETSADSWNQIREEWVALYPASGFYS